MALTVIPPASSLSDGQFVQVQGPDGITTGYHFDKQQRALYFKESQVLFPSFHGATHIAEDPVPNATCDTPGLMSNNDKCKLDALLQTRVGVLGFQGAGFPDDGGWMQGDIILAAGTEFISLERIGNVVRFTVDSPIPLNCACFKAGARVLMANGITKAIEDIVVGDEVITHEGRIKPVVNLMRNHHKGKISNWKVDKHSGEAFAITDNHPVMALKREKAFFASGKTRPAVLEAPDWTYAGELGAGDLVVRRRSHDIIDDIDTIDVMRELGEGYVERDGLVFPCIVGGPRDGQIDGMAHGIPRYIPVNDDLLDLIGYYAAEGSADIKNGLRFTIHTKELAFGEIGHDIRRKLASVFLIEPKIQNKHTENGKDIQVCSKVLSMLFLKWCGIGKSKHLPEWVMKLTAGKQQRIIVAILKGDGYVTHTHVTNYITLGLSARGLIDQCLFIAERCGWEPAHQPSKLIRGKVRHRMSITTSKALNLCEVLGIDHKPSKLNRERVIDDHVMHRIAEWSEEYYEGIVYNFEVMDDNSYIVDGVVVHNCEECQQIFWVQDETDTASIRPPTCGGKLPGVNAYGEMKIYLFPESTIADPNNTGATLQNKGQYPTWIFKRYDDSIVPGTAEHEMVLKRDSNNLLQTEIGWAFTPGAIGVPEMVWFMGKDDEGSQIRFDLNPETTPGLLGSLLYNGHLLTKKMGVIVDYTATILSTNQYTVREWDVDSATAIGSPFTATNVWMYQNPENPASGNNPKALILDNTIDLLPIGSLVSLWFFKVGEVSGEPILRYYFKEKPRFNPNHAWTWVGKAQFGDVTIAREEVAPGGGSEDKDAATQVSAIRVLERSMWGLTGYDDPLLSFDIASTAGTDSADMNVQHRAIIDTALPGLKVVASSIAPDDFSERPVWLWNRHNLCNMLVRADIGRPDSSSFVPFDVVIRGDIDENTNKYVRVIGKGTINGLNYVRVCGVHFHDLPPFGTIRVLSPDSNQNIIYNYTRKFVFPTSVEDPTVGTEPTGGFPPLTLDGCDSIVLTGDASSNVAYPGDIGDICELLHQEYSSPVVRVEFSYTASTGLVEVQFKVGTLDMSLPYEEDIAGNDLDDYVRGLAPGYAVSAVYSQAGTYTGVGTQPTASPEGFVVYDGGAVVGGSQSEFWNRLEIMVRDDQVWIWWNQLLIPPNPTLSNGLPTPVDISTPYFPIEQIDTKDHGKAGLRLWPGAKVRRMDVRTQLTLFNEFTYGQLEVT